MFNIEFSIKVNKLPSSTWTNVFHFTADGANGKYGDRIPALYIHKDGYFQVCSAVNDNENYIVDIDFEVGRQYQMAILQYRNQTQHWYEVMIDGTYKCQIENTQPRSFPNVKFYASDPWIASFSSNLGSVCNLKIGGMYVPIRLWCTAD